MSRGGDDRASMPFDIANATAAARARPRRTLIAGPRGYTGFGGPPETRDTRERHALIGGAGATAILPV